MLEDMIWKETSVSCVKATNDEEAERWGANGSLLFNIILLFFSFSSLLITIMIFLCHFFSFMHVRKNDPSRCCFIYLLEEDEKKKKKNRCNLVVSCLLPYQRYIILFFFYYYFFFTHYLSFVYGRVSLLRMRWSLRSFYYYFFFLKKAIICKDSTSGSFVYTIFWVEKKNVEKKIKSFSTDVEIN